MRELSRVVTLLLLAAFCGAVACSGTPRVELHGATARLSPMLARTCSVFLEIRNAGDGGDALLGARVDADGAAAEVHDVKDGRMFRTGRLAVPAGGVLGLRPGGPHIMVFKLPKDTGAGAELVVHLQFERSGERQTSVRIRGWQDERAGAVEQAAMGSVERADSR